MWMSTVFSVNWPAVSVSPNLHTHSGSHSEGSVQRYLTWVENSSNCWVWASDHGAGHYFGFLKVQKREIFDSGFFSEIKPN